MNGLLTRNRDSMLQFRVFALYEKPTGVGKHRLDSILRCARPAIFGEYAERKETARCTCLASSRSDSRFQEIPVLSELNTVGRSLKRFVKEALPHPNLALARAANR
jgi:hypothetical protein